VSGTSRQAVAEDYIDRLYKAMKLNSYEYTKLLADKVKTETGYVSSGLGWYQCEKTNGTYLDCPIGKFDGKDNFTMYVAVQNPSNVDMKQARIPISEGHYLI